MSAMASTWQTAAGALTQDLARIFGDRLRSVVVYGAQLDGNASAPVTTMALVASLTIPDLEACARHWPSWTAAGIAAPLLLPEAEFRESLDAFPLEYAEMMRAHVHVHGADPFEGVEIPQADHRLACEIQVKSHLLHLREGFVESGGRLPAIAGLVTAGAPAFAALLRNVARLDGVQSHDRMEATRQGARAAGLSEDIVEALLALEQPAGIPSSDPARLFPAYLTAVERLATFVNTWRSV